MENLYEIVEKKNKEIEALKQEIEKLEESKAYFENRIQEEENRNSSNELTKGIIANKVQDLQNKIDNYHFKHEFKIESDFTINKLSLVYCYENVPPQEISTSGASMLYELEKWIKFQSRLIPIYKLLEKISDNLVYARIKSQYSNNYKDSTVSFCYSYEDSGFVNVRYILDFNKYDYSTFKLTAFRKVLKETVKAELTLDDKGLKAHIVTPEAEKEFDDRDFDPSETFNIYLTSSREKIDETMLKDVIEETAKQILNYTDFEEDCW